MPVAARVRALAAKAHQGCPSFFAVDCPRGLPGPGDEASPTFGPRPVLVEGRDASGPHLHRAKRRGRRRRCLGGVRDVPRHELLRPLAEGAVVARVEGVVGAGPHQVVALRDRGVRWSLPEPPALPEPRGQQDVARHRLGEVDRVAEIGDIAAGDPVQHWSVKRLHAHGKDALDDSQLMHQGGGQGALRTCAVADEAIHLLQRRQSFTSN